MLVVLLGAASACDGDNPVGPTAGGTGSLSVRITDSPFSDAEALVVRFSEVSVHRSDDGEWVSLPFAEGATERACDLKQLTTAEDVLGVGALEAGQYTQLRLIIIGAELFFDNQATDGPCAPAITDPAGTSEAVRIPSGTIRLNPQFTLSEGGATTILLDFDGDRSVKQTGGGYLMTPVITVVSVQ